MDTSDWIFLEDSGVSLKKSFDPYNRLTLSTQKKKKHNNNFFANITINNNKRKQTTKEHPIVSLTIVSRSEDDSPTHEKAEKRKESKEDIMTSLRDPVEKPNPYLLLVNRLDEEEGVKMPSIEDRLKLAEDKLRLSALEFCKACDEFIPQSGKDEEDGNRLMFLTPEFVQESLKPKVLEHSTPSPQIVDRVADGKDVPEVTMPTLDFDKMVSKKSPKMEINKFKQAYYLPPNTWFTEKKEKSKMTEEEKELLNSTSTREFLKFLEERKKEPPKVLQELQMKMRKNST